MNLQKPFQSSSLVLKLELQRQTHPSRQPICLFTDLDDTYLMKYWPPESTLEKLSQKHSDIILSPNLAIYNSTKVLKEYLDSQNIPLVIVSGRDLHQLSELKKSFLTYYSSFPNLLDFDAIIGAVGTEIYIRSSTDTYEIDPGYQALVEKSGFNRQTLHKLLSDLIPTIRATINPIVIDFSKRDHPDSVDELPKQDHKISVEFKSDEMSSKLIVDTIHATFDAHGFTHFKIILSSPYAIDNKIHKYNLDIVPFSKDVPINYMKKLLDLTSIVAGDSGNDYDMLTKSADIGIVVGNAKKELKAQISLLNEDNKKHILFVENLEGPEAVEHALKKILSDKL